MKEGEEEKTLGAMSLVRGKNSIADLTGERQLKAFPLFCPMCRRESRINAKDFIIETKEARR